MKTFQYNDQTFAVIDGDLWLKLPLSVTPPVLPDAMPARKRRKKRVSGSQSMTQAQQRIREYRPRKHLGPDAEEAVKADIAAGMSLTETCRKYEIAVSTFYRLKNEINNGPVTETNDAGNSNQASD